MMSDHDVSHQSQRTRPCAETLGTDDIRYPHPHRHPQSTKAPLGGAVHPHPPAPPPLSAHAHSHLASLTRRGPTPSLAAHAASVPSASTASAPPLAAVRRWPRAIFIVPEARGASELADLRSRFPALSVAPSTKRRVTAKLVEPSPHSTRTGAAEP